MNKNFDALVVGAGYIGCSVAYYLTQAGVKTALLDRDSVGGGASRANYGNIQVQDAEMDHSLPMVVEGYRHCLEIEKELDRSVGYYKLGSLLTIETEAQWKTMESRLPGLRQVGIEAELIPAERIPELEPLLSPKHLLGALYNPNEGQIVPFDLMWAYVSRAREQGLKYFQSTEVVDFILSPNMDQIKGVITDQGRFESPVVILTTGAWTKRLGQKIGRNWKIDFVHGQAFITQAIDRALNNHLASAAFFEDSHEDNSEETGLSESAVLAISQSAHGHLLLGEASFPTEQIGYNVTPGAASAIAHQVTRMFPSFKELSALRSWASPVAYTHDGRPFLGPVEGLSGLFLATAFRSTVIATPLAGKTIAQLVTKGHSDLDISAFSPDRPQ
jgi:glycine/D-amino acid oxidase-like deaminating enzyme